MMRGVRIGRVFGVDVRVDWSWILIFVLLTWNLFAVFSGWHPRWPVGESLLVAVAGSLIFFLCILLHELSHSLVAQAHGTRVRSITLFLFGGVSNIEREPKSPGAEFLTAVVGPITSILLGILFIVLASFAIRAPAAAADDPAQLLARMGPFETLLVWLGPINVLIGLFNLVPAFPLDGGRIVRAALWGATHDLRRATRWAAGLGQVIAWAFIFAGIAMTFGAYIPYFGTGFVGGLWLAFIGWFLYSAAAQATARLALDDALTGLTVGRLMHAAEPGVAPDCSIAALVQDHFLRGADRAVPVVDADQRLIGLVAISDIRHVAPEEWSITPVASVMRPASELSVATPDESLLRAFEILAEQDIDQMPVVASDGRLLGMLRRRDVTRWLELAWRPGTGAPRPAAVSPRASTPGRGPEEPGDQPRPFPGHEAHPHSV